MAGNTEMQTLLKAAFRPKEWEQLMEHAEFAKAVSEAKGVDETEAVIELGTALLISMEDKSAKAKPPK